MEANDQTPVSTADARAQAAAIGRLLDRLVATEQDLRPLAEALPGFAGPARRVFAERLISRLREIGDDAHQAARTIKDILRR